MNKIVLEIIIRDLLSDPTYDLKLYLEGFQRGIQGEEPGWNWSHELWGGIQWQGYREGQAAREYLGIPPLAEFNFKRFLESIRLF